MTADQLLGFEAFALLPYDADDLEDGTVLEIDIQHQQAGNWCWAAVATSLSEFYQILTPWQQCTLVEAELSVVGCCVSPTPYLCNQTHYLSDALTRVGHLNSHGSGIQPFAMVRDEIDGGRPVCIAVEKGDQAHFAVICGYAGESAPLMILIDSLDTTAVVDYGADVSSAFGDDAEWTYSYLTQP